MFKQSRKKIIISIMGSVILLFAMTLFVIFFVSYRNMRARNIDMMSRHTWKENEWKERLEKEREEEENRIFIEKCKERKGKEEEEIIRLKEKEKINKSKNKNTR